MKRFFCFSSINSILPQYLFPNCSSLHNLIKFVFPTNRITFITKSVSFFSYVDFYLNFTSFMYIIKKAYLKIIFTLNSFLKIGYK
jgi:hypothetical protein